MRKLSAIVKGTGVLAGGLLFFIAGIILLNSAMELMSLKSQSGNSVAEAYYQQMGQHGLGYSIISFAFGLATISLSLALGEVLRSRENNTDVNPQTPSV
jgi:hypothetical protein